MKEIKNIHISDFDYELPDERIPRHPLRERDGCKLLVSNPDGTIRHHIFAELPELLPQNAVLVCNDTRVINARIHFEKITGSRIEIFLLEPISPADYVLMFQSVSSCRWGCLVGNLKRWKEEPLKKELKINGKTVSLTAHKVKALEGNGWEILFEWDDPNITFATIVEAAGYIPIPPYLKRDSEKADSEDYQTVYAKVQGSVAAPTAGLHFTPALFERLEEAGVETIPLTLHVGAGTFQPVKSETIGGHPMHTEVFSIDRDALEKIIDAKKLGRPVAAVGTTSVRTLESLPYLGAHIIAGSELLNVKQWDPYEEVTDMSSDGLTELNALLGYMDKKGISTLTATTSIMIAPGFAWRIVDVMITNFHQPQSTLLLLVSSFLDRNKHASGSQWKQIYKEALENHYRFLSYGDACLLFPHESLK